MGNASSAHGDGIPFVSWKRLPDAATATHDANTNAADANANDSSSSSTSSTPRPGRDRSFSGFTALAANVTATVAGGVATWHFAEASCYQYTKCPRVIAAPLVWADPPKADGELRNKAAILGSLVVVERGGRVHFPDIIRRLLAAGAAGCVFLERGHTAAATQSLFDGFHSSGRQSVAMPIVLLTKFHADQLVRDRPARAAIEYLSGEAAIQHIVPDDQVVAVSSAARAGEGEVLKHILYADTTGSIRERIHKAVAMCDAAENGHVDCLEMLHGFGISLDEQKPNGTTALMMASSVGNVEAARALLMFGANVDLEDVHGLTALMIAVRDGKPQCVKLLIRKGARINLSRNRNRGTTALHIAARGGLEECVTILLDAGAALEVRSPNSTTALMEAARAGNQGCVQLLLDAGASLDAKDREGLTAEMLARLSGHPEIEDMLRERAESESVKDHRRKIEEAVKNPEATLQQLLLLAEANNISVDVLQREVTRDLYVNWLQQPRIIDEVFRLLTLPTQKSLPPDPTYGYYKIQHFCCEMALLYPRRIFEKGGRYSGNGSAHALDELDAAKSARYLSILFGFLSTPGELDDVLVVLFCKVVNHFILTLQVGKLLIGFLARDGQCVVQGLVNHIGLDSIRDTLVWLLYSDMSDQAQDDIRTSGIFDSLFSRLTLWQRTLSWGVGTPYQRDSIENICLLLNYIIYPPSVYMMGNVATFVENTDQTLPLINDQYYPTRHNELLKSLLMFCHVADVSFGTLIDLGFAEVFRQSTQNVSLVVQEGGTLSIIMMAMSALGYHKRKRDMTGIENLLQQLRAALMKDVVPRAPKFVKLCHAIIHGDESRLRELVHVPANQKLHLKPKGSALLSIVSFLKRCIFLQDSMLNQVLAEQGLMPCLLECYAAHPSNNLLHHELTDVIRFVLMDPDQKRSPACPLLNSLFSDSANLLDFVTRSYDSHVEYKGHLTTIANSIFTLTNTPAYKNDDGHQQSCHDLVRGHTGGHANWAKFEAILAEQNLLEMQPLGQRNAPLCDGCLGLKEHADEYVTSTLATEVTFSGYLEKIFSGAASHYCKVNTTDDFITGFLYKKDKIHDHIPIPEPTRVSSFIQFPVPMPFHALTFTLTFFGLCRKCDKLWYCDTLQGANWATRMKWVIPTSARKWYSFGVSEGPGSGAHGIQFSTKGYKGFIILSDTWGRQEQWMHAMEEAILGVSSQASRRMDAANALAIEIDNEVDTNEFDMTNMNRSASPTDSDDDDAWQHSGRDDLNRKRSKTVSESSSEMNKRGLEFSSDDENENEHDSEIDSENENDSDGHDKTTKLRNQFKKTGSARNRNKTRPASALASSTGLASSSMSSLGPSSTTSPSPSRRAAYENALRTGQPLPLSPPKKPMSTMRTSGSEHNLSKFALKQFQDDAKRYTEILNNLKRSSTATPVGVGLSSPLKVRARNPLDRSSHVSGLNGKSDLPPRRVSSTSTISSMVSARDLASMGQ